MVNSRVDRKAFPFFDSVKHPQSIAGTSDSFRNNGYESMVLEVAGPTAISLKVQGCVNILDANDGVKEDADCVWSDISVINKKGFQVSDSISAAGIYDVSIAGLSRVRVVVESITGEATILGVAGL